VTDLPYDVFISYRRSDGSKTAQWIRRELEAFRAPRALQHKFSRKLRVYLDVAFERGTIDFYEHTIRPALMASRHLLVIATPDAALRENPERDWIKREIDEFSGGEYGSNLLVVRGLGRFDGPLPADLATRFENIEIVDLRDVSRFWFLNPLRASRIANEKIKLIAPIIGIDARDMPILRREEERRQQSRIAAVLGASLAIFVAISALTVFALHSRARATVALESSLASTGSLILSLGRSASGGGRARQELNSLISDACDVFDKLRIEANADPRARPLVVCYGRRASDHENLKELPQARKLLDVAIVHSLAIHQRSRQNDDARSVVTALSQLQGFLDQNGTPEQRKAHLVRTGKILDELIAEQPDEPLLVEARLRAVAGIAAQTDADKASSELIAELDRVADLAARSAPTAYRNRADILVWQAKLLMAASLFTQESRPGDATARLGRADGALDMAVAADVEPKPKPGARLDVIDAYLRLSTAYARLGRPADALRILEKGARQLASLKEAELSRSENVRLQKLSDEIAGARRSGAAQ
jgi:tetratricopeptide (TPR) repeat protein